MSTTYPIVRTAVKKLGAKTFALISPEHEHKPVKRGDMVKIKVEQEGPGKPFVEISSCLLYTSPSPRDGLLSRMPSSA